MNLNHIPQIVQALSDERNLDPGVIFEALELALAAAAKKHNLLDIDARVAIDKETGDFETFRRWEVVSDDEEIEFPDRQLSLTEAREQHPEIGIGEFIEEYIPSKAVGRISAQAARQVVMQKVREAERERVLSVYSPQIGSMLFGVVRRIDRGDAIVDIDSIEALLPRSSGFAKDGLRQGDRIRAILKEVRTEPRGPQLILDRTCPELLIELFKIEVPETREGLVEIRNAARDPGLRAKIAVHSNDPKIDPIGACVGVRGARVQSVSNEIAGERVDIVQWSQNAVQFVINALAPAEVESIFIESQSQSMDVVVADSQLSQAIGRGGQNVRLASQLTGWNLNILTKAEAELKAADEAVVVRTKLMEMLDIDEDVAMILVQNGYQTMLDIAYADTNVLTKIEHFDAGLVEAIQSRATDAMIKQEMGSLIEAQENVPDETLYAVEGMDPETAVVLASHGIRTMEELGDCATFDLIEIPGMGEERAKELIMSARGPMLAMLEQQQSGE